MIRNMIIFGLVLLLFPVLIGFFIKDAIFSFAGGSTESWVSFWGSYGGAIIGASTVYLVTSLQMKEQRRLQIESIRIEHDNALKRENKHLFLSQQIEKIEETFISLDEILNLMLKLSNKFTKYILLREHLDKRELSEEQIKSAKEDKNKEFEEIFHYIHMIINQQNKMRRFSLYLNDLEFGIDSISTIIISLTADIKKGVFSKNYDIYLENGDSVYAQNYIDSFIKERVVLENQILNPLLQKIIKERSDFLNNS